MIPALFGLLFLQLLGEVLVSLVGLPVPGPVVGMLLLFLYLMMRGEADESLKGVSQVLLQNLSLLFIPAGAGILLHVHRLADDWLPIVLSVFVSTLLTMMVTGLMVQWLGRGGKKNV